jgi:hypothetical protein
MPPANAPQKDKKKTGDSSPPHRDGRGVAPGLCEEHPMTEQTLQPHFVVVFPLGAFVEHASQLMPHTNLPQ